MNEIEYVSFLPGQSNSNKRAIYEPDNIRKCQQIVCSPRKATAIVSCFVVVILIIALIAAFARTSTPGNACIMTTPSPSSDSVAVATTPPLATNGEVFPWTDIRLPADIKPLTYNLFLHPNLTTFAFKGNVSIMFLVTKATSFIVYHIKDLQINSEALHRIASDGTVTNEIKIRRFLQYLKHEQVYMELDSELKAGETYRLVIEFSGMLADNLAGFYKSSYETSSRQKRWLATTHFEATDARAAFPCFDEPQLKANFTLSMMREPGYLSLFNTEQVGMESLDNGALFVDRFATSVTMSTYLVAFVVCDFGAKSALTQSNVNVSVYAPREMLDQADYALSVATRVLDFYESYYNISYPLKKCDHIAIPDFSAGAMENWGLVTYLMRSLLYNPQESSVSDQQWVAVVVTHELAHQWFGNLVTMKWWNDLWLNEGFARFVEYLGSDFIQPGWRMKDQFLDDALAVALYSDGLVSSHPISVPVNDPAEIGEIFDAISYEKGASIIRMLQSVIGEQAFISGVRTYLRTHMFGNAETDDLWAAMTKEVSTVSGKLDIKSIMDTWTLQMGYPVITVTRTGNKIKASQERFLYNPRGNQTEEFQSAFGYKWYVPLTYITQNDQSLQPVQWMETTDVSFSIRDSPGWIKMNANMTGLYRVHYDEDNWNALIRQLNTDHTVLSAADRASLISDSFALARSGHLNITVALELTRYLVNETEYIPWQTALSSLSYIGDLLEGLPEYDYYNTYVSRLIDNIQEQLTWSDSGSHIDKLLRASVLGESLKLGVKKNVQQVQKMFSDWANNNSPISANLRTLVYSGGVKYGGDEEWEAVWDKYLVSQTPSEKSKLLYALSATTDALRLNRFLQLSLDESKVRSSETPSVIQSVAANPAGRILAWRFVRANWDVLHARYHNVMMKMKRVIVGSTGHFTTLFDYEEVKSFFFHNLHGENLRSVSQSLDKIEMNIDWLARNKVTVISWLKKNTGL